MFDFNEFVGNLDYCLDTDTVYNDEYGLGEEW